MSKRLAAALLTATCLASGAHAGPWDAPPSEPWAVPQPNLIPMPGMIEPQWELGARYWWSEGKTKFGVNANKVNPALGIPNSTLTYDKVEGNAAEFVFRGRTESDIFAKGFVGGGSVNGGSLHETGSSATLGDFSYTDPNLAGTNLVYGTLDIGKRFTLSQGPAKVTLGPFIGFNLWQEQIETNGARCKPDDVICNTGTSHNVFHVPFDTDQVGWAALRLGGELQVKLFDRFTLIGDAAVLPIAYLVNDQGANTQNTGHGWGYQLEAALRVDLTPCWSLGSGVRYWFAEVTDGTSKFADLNSTAALNDFTSQRFGVFGDLTYKF